VRVIFTGWSRAGDLTGGSRAGDVTGWSRAGDLTGWSLTLLMDFLVVKTF